MSQIDAVPTFKCRSPVSSLFVNIERFDKQNLRIKILVNRNLITSLAFAHTARRYYRLSVLVRTSDCLLGGSRCLAGEKTSKLLHLEEVKVVTRFP